MITAAANTLIKKIKGDHYSIDPRVPSFYMINLMSERASMFLRGLLSFIKNDGMLFIAENVVVKARGKIMAGKGVTIDMGCYIDALSREGIKLGNNVSVGKRTVIECSGSLRHLGKGIIVGNNVGLGRDCFYGCAGGIIIGMDTIIGNFVSFHSENHNTSELHTPIRLQGVNHKGITVGNNCWIGAKATILDGARIGSGCIIAAGSVMLAGDYEADSIYGGVPAKFLKKRT